MTESARLDRDAARGTSLIEVLTALSILALGAIVAAPFFAMTPERKLSRLETALIESLLSARSQALRANETVRWTLDPKRAAVETRGPSAVSNATLGDLKAVKVAARDAATLGGAGSPLELLFYPDGASSGLQLSLTAGEKMRVIAIDPIGGALRRSEAE